MVRLSNTMCCGGGGGGGGGKEGNPKEGHILKDPGEHTMTVLIQRESLSDGCLH